MDMEEPLDFKSLCEKYTHASRSSTLPANYSRPQHDQISAANISHVRSNPALQGVISVLEGQVKPPIAKKPALPVGISGIAKPSLAPANRRPTDFLRAKLSTEKESMKLNKMFRQTLHIMDHSRMEGDGKSDSRPQVYRLSCPNIPEPRAPQPAAPDCYEDVDSDFLTKADPSLVTNDLIKSANSSPSMSSKTWRPVEHNYSFPSHSLSPTKANVSHSHKLDGGDDKQKPYCVSKTPKLKSLPSIESLGPPPPKDPRPPNVDLSAFLTGSQQDRTENVREETPGAEYELSSPSSALSEGEYYEDTFHFDESAESGSNMYEVEALDHETSEVEKNEPFATSPSSEELDQECYTDILKLSDLESDLNVYEEEETYTLSDPDLTEDSYYEVSEEAHKELGPPTTVMETYPSFASSEGYHSAGEMEMEKGSPAGSETYTMETKTGKSENGVNTVYTATIMEGFKPEKHTLTVMKGDKVKIIRITDCPIGKWLAQDENGSYGFVPVSCVNINKDILNYHNAPSSLIPITPEDKTRTPNGGAGADLSMGSDSYSIKSNDVYDDIGINPVAPNNPVGKSKGFVHLFRRDKGKKEDLGSGYATPHLNTMSQEGSEYSTQGISRPHEKEKEEKSAGWRTIFHSNKEQRGRSETLGAEGSVFAHYLEGKLNTPGVLKKYAKEEKIFREKFKYTGDINAINIATINDLAPLSAKEKLELAVTAGETVEVIDVVNEEKIICRNIAGKYGYVRIEYLNFQPEHFS
ncbi:FYN-binding protein 2 isoform X2 [Pseudophryne corroboree]|uniref:FYN-binding protein 2 isoform X2 n=1 Tax=Pseudophryne corroboree TaxID=495146 RepID=UPI003081E27E